MNLRFWQKSVARPRQPAVYRRSDLGQRKAPTGGWTSGYAVGAHGSSRAILMRIKIVKPVMIKIVICLDYQSRVA